MPVVSYLTNQQTINRNTYNIYMHDPQMKTVCIKATQNSISIYMYIRKEGMDWVGKIRLGIFLTFF